MKVYYAHAVAFYGSQREQRARDFLRGVMGWEVVCPNDDPEHEAGFQAEGMAYFDRLVRERGVEAIAYEPFDDGWIGSGVAYELSFFERVVRPDGVYRLTHPDAETVGLAHEPPWACSLPARPVLTRPDTRERNRRIRQELGLPSWS